MQSSWVGKFALLSVIWGASFALIKVAVEAGVPPVWVAFGRCAFGALALGLVCLVTRTRLPRDRRTWGHALVVATLLNAVPFTLLAFGETLVTSVLAGVFNATMPLTTLVFVLLVVPAEKVTAARVAGLVVGFSGVLVVLGVWDGVGGDVLVGGLACLGATTFYGAGYAYTRRFFSGGSQSAGALSAVQVTCAAGELAIAAPIIGGVPEWPGWFAVGALVVLGAAGTGWAYVLNLDVIRAAGPTVAATVTYVAPVWSMVVGALLLSEPVGWNTVVGGAVVIAGVLLARKPHNGGIAQKSGRQVVRSNKPR
ncbi:hypothetical protein SUDANB95_05407 [Actinosynnema sp. ALI-1.44]